MLTLEGKIRSLGRAFTNRAAPSERIGTRRQDTLKEAKIEECQKAWVSFPSLQVRQQKIWSFQFLARSFSALPAGKRWKSNATNSVWRKPDSHIVFELRFSPVFFRLFPRCHPNPARLHWVCYK